MKTYFENKRYSIKETDLSKTGIIVEDKVSLRCNFPTKYSNGTFGWDNPEWFPKYIREKVYDLGR